VKLIFNIISLENVLSHLNEKKGEGKISDGTRNKNILKIIQ
jgi:hypothetical protein